VKEVLKEARHRRRVCGDKFLGREYTMRRLISQILLTWDPLPGEPNLLLLHYMNNFSKDLILQRPMRVACLQSTIYPGIFGKANDGYVGQLV
jgi:hypothetical protein